MRIQVVSATVHPDLREAYLRAWAEWSGTLFAMKIRADLLESETLPGSFVELTWFESGTEGALADDRLVRAAAALDAAANREGSLEFFRPVRLDPSEAGPGGRREP
jgi:hypothetical protein